MEPIKHPTASTHEVLGAPNTPNPAAQPQTLGAPNQHKAAKAVFYWSDGYWVADKEDAELADEFGAFAGKHQTAYFPADADPAFIDDEIAALLTRQSGEVM